MLRDVVLGGVPLIAFLQIDKVTGGLKRVQIERQRHGVNPPAFRGVLRPNRLHQHGPVHRLRHRQRGSGTHRDRRNGMAALTPIKELSTQTQPRSGKQAIVLIVLLSLGLWALIWELVVAIMTLIGG